MNWAEPPLKYVLIAAVNITVYMLLSLFSYRAVPAEHGWHKVRPGPYHWVALLLSAALELLLLAIGMVGGWPPFEGEYQIFYGLLATCTAAVLWLPAYIRTLRTTDIWWRDNWIAFTHPAHGRIVQNMCEIAHVTIRWDQSVVLKFADAMELKIDPYCKGAEQLGQAVQEAIGTRKAA